MNLIKKFCKILPMLNVRTITCFLSPYLYLVLGGCDVNAQDSIMKKSSITCNLFIDHYYSFQFSNRKAREKVDFIYNHNRLNEISINLALLTLTYTGGRTRTSVGLMSGTYPQYNLAHEPAVMRHIYEANTGLNISKKNNIWLDVGILPSHIGFESMISKNCMTLTRSIQAENSPYYESGLRLSYSGIKERLNLAVFVLNGWQQIYRSPGNNTPSFGTQVFYTASDHLHVNWSTFLGNVKPDSVAKWRFFNNVYAVWHLTKHWGLTLGLDHGIEQQSPFSSNYNTWYSPIMIVRYARGSWALAGRGEYYSDRSGVIIQPQYSKPVQMLGYSLNIDKKFCEHILARVEWRLLQNKFPYFTQPGGPGRSNHSVTTSLAFDL